MLRCQQYTPEFIKGELERIVGSPDPLDGKSFMETVYGPFSYGLDIGLRGKIVEEITPRTGLTEDLISRVTGMFEFGYGFGVDVLKDNLGGNLNEEELVTLMVKLNAQIFDYCGFGQYTDESKEAIDEIRVQLREEIGEMKRKWYPIPEITLEENIQN